MALTWILFSAKIILNIENTYTNIHTELLFPRLMT